MATHQAKQILIRHRDNDDEPNNHQHPSKIQRFEPSDDDEVQPAKIIDLNDDCLMKIFGYLNLKSLFNVALANKWLQAVAVEMYYQKFGTKKVQISKCSNGRKNGKHSELKQKSDFIKVRGLKACLQFLRCFGPSIDHLVIDYNESKSKRYEYVLQYINEYCAEDLVTISFDCMPNVAIEHEQLQNVFSNVKVVQFQLCSLERQLPSIAECFPNVQILYLVHNAHGETTKMIQESFEHLEDIHIHACNDIQSSKSVANLLQMAYPLKNLVIGALIPTSTLLDWIKYNRSLSQLNVGFDLNVDAAMDATMPVKSEEVQHFINNHPALVELHLPNYRFAVDDAIRMVRELHSLKEFCFRIKRTDYTYFVNQSAVVWKTEKCDTSDSKYVVVELNR